MVKNTSLASYGVRLSWGAASQPPRGLGWVPDQLRHREPSVAFQAAENMAGSYKAKRRWISAEGFLVLHWS